MFFGDGLRMCLGVLLVVVWGWCVFGDDVGMVCRCVGYVFGMF